MGDVSCVHQITWSVPNLSDGCPPSCRLLVKITTFDMESRPTQSLQAMKTKYIFRTFTLVSVKSATQRDRQHWVKTIASFDGLILAVRARIQLTARFVGEIRTGFFLSPLIYLK